MARKLKTTTPPEGTPTARYVRTKDTLYGIKVWLKGRSPTGRNDSRSPYNERAAYVLSEMLELGLVPTTVLHLRKGEVVSAQEWVEGDRPYRQAPPVLDMFDYLIGNDDRHGGNWLIKKGGGVWAIDNAFTFYTDEISEFHYQGKLPDGVENKLIEMLENGKKELHKQLDWLIGKEEVTAVIWRIRRVLKGLHKASPKS